jgi:transcriptional regulator with XRE-family HTH domain
MESMVHMGHNIKRFRQLADLSQQDLADKLGYTWSQKKVSEVEQKAIVEDDILAEVSKILNVPKDALEKLDDAAAVNILSNTFNDSSQLNGILYHPTFNPVDKLIEVYEVRLREKDAEIARLQKENEKLRKKR